MDVALLFSRLIRTMLPGPPGPGHTPGATLRAARLDCL